MLARRRMSKSTTICRLTVSASESTCKLLDGLKQLSVHFQCSGLSGCKWKCLFYCNIGMSLWPVCDLEL